MGHAWANFIPSAHLQSPRSQPTIRSTAPLECPRTLTSGPACPVHHHARSLFRWRSCGPLSWGSPSSTSRELRAATPHGPWSGPSVPPASARAVVPSRGEYFFSASAFFPGLSSTKHHCTDQESRVEEGAAVQVKEPGSSIGSCTINLNQADAWELCRCS